MRNAEILSFEEKHPIVLDSKHAVTQLIIQNYDNKLLHPGPERVLTEIRIKFWVLCGQEAI